MRYALVSDIHANWQAWKAVLDDIEKAGVDGIICLGDIIGYGPQPAKVLESVYEASDLFMLGNHDAVICGRFDSECFNDEAKIIIDWTASQLNDSAVDFFNHVTIMVLAEEFAGSHDEFAVPERYDYIYDPHEAVESLQATEQPLLFVGHTHYPGTIRADQDGKLDYFKPQDFSLQKDSRYLVNVGSVGDPRNGDIRASYCIYDLEKNAVEYRNVPFDIDEFRMQIAQAGIPTKPILFDYAGRPIGSEADTEATKIRDFHVNADAVKAAAGNKSSIERITESGIHHRSKIKISAGSVGDGVAFRSAQAVQQRATKLADKKKKKVLAVVVATTLCVVAIASAAYFVFYSQKNGNQFGVGGEHAHLVTANPNLDTSVPNESTASNIAAATAGGAKIDPGTWITETSTVYALVPSAENGGSALGESWQAVRDPENMAQWTKGMNGVGFETKSPGYKTMLNVEFPEMFKVNSTCYIRIPFTTPGLTSHADISSLLLEVCYDDGYIAYLNGTRIAEENAPEEPTWNSDATAQHDDKLAVLYKPVDISQYIKLLQIGSTNVLAIHGMNGHLNSSDMLILPRFRSKSTSEIATGSANTKQFNDIIERLSSNKLPVTDAINELTALRPAALNASLLTDIDLRLNQLEAERTQGISTVITDLTSKAKELEAQHAPEQAAKIYTAYTGPYAVETAEDRKALAAPLLKQQAEVSTIVTSFKNQITQLLLEQKFEEAFACYTDNKAEFPHLINASAYKQLADELDHIQPAHQKIMDSFDGQKSKDVNLKVNNHEVQVRIEGIDEDGYLVVRPHTGDSYAAPSPLPLYRISMAERLKRMGTDTSAGAEVIRGIMYAHSGETKSAGDHLAKSKLKIGATLKNQLGSIGEQYKDEQARKAIDGLKLTMGITSRTADAKQMRMMVFSRSKNKAILQTYKHKAHEIKKAFASTSSYKEEAEFFNFVETLTPLVSIRPLKNPTALYAFSRNTISADRKTMRDASPKRINLEVSGAPKFERTEFGELLYFDGKKTALTVPNKSPVPAGSPFTITFWSKPEKKAGLSCVFALGNRDAAFKSLIVGYKDDRYSLHIPGVKFNASQLPKVTYDVWHYNIVRYQSGKLEWKVNTQSDMELPIPKPIEMAIKLRIGVAPNEKNTSTGYYQGFLKDMFFYDRAISDEEVKHLFDQTK